MPQFLITALYVVLISFIAIATVYTYLVHKTLYAILGLLCVLLSVAAIFFLQGAVFVAVAQILVYGSGALLFFLYDILLPASTKSHSKWRGGAVLLTMGVTISPLAWVAAQVLAQRGIVLAQNDAVTQLGLQLAGPYVLAFELVGLMLLIALVGAATIIAPDD